MGIWIANSEGSKYNVNTLGHKLKTLVTCLKEYWLVFSLFLIADPISIDTGGAMDVSNCVEINLSGNQSLQKCTLNLIFKI